MPGAGSTLRAMRLAAAADRGGGYAKEHDDVRRALETAFCEALTDKLVATNARVAG